MINKLIGHDVLATGILPTIGRIHRVMHSEKMRVKTYHSGCPEPNELSFNSVGELHKFLKNLQNMDTEDNLVSQVDVLLPFSKIQVKNQSNFIFIDIRKTNKISFCGLLYYQSIKHLMIRVENRMGTSPLWTHLGSVTQ